MANHGAQGGDSRGLLRPRLGAGRVLLAVASPVEARAILRALDAHERLAEEEWNARTLNAWADMVVTGVCKANAAGAIARTLAPDRHALVLNLGVGGSLPARGERPGPPLGALVIASSSAFGDEGLSSSEGFTDVAAMGFPPAPGVGVSFPGDPRALHALRGASDAIGAAATVSTCSGTDALAGKIHRRTGAIVESMEGAAAALVAHRLGVPFVEVRAVSNTTGDRAAQRWNMALALSRLERFVRAL